MVRYYPIYKRSYIQVQMKRDPTGDSAHADRVPGNEPGPRESLTLFREMAIHTQRVSPNSFQLCPGVLRLSRRCLLQRRRRRLRSWWGRRRAGHRGWRHGRCTFHASTTRPARLQAEYGTPSAGTLTDYRGTPVSRYSYWACSQLNSEARFLKNLPHIA